MTFVTLLFKNEKNILISLIPLQKLIKYHQELLKQNKKFVETDDINNFILSFTNEEMI